MVLLLVMTRSYACDMHSMHVSLRQNPKKLQLKLPAGWACTLDLRAEDAAQSMLSASEA